MANIKLTVNTNFADASKDIKSLGTLTETETNKMDKALKNLSTESLDKFERNLTRTTAAVKATKGPTEAMRTQQRMLSTQIQRSIKAGVDPLDDSLVKLQKEYADTTKQIEVNNKALELNAKTYDVAKKATLGMIVGLGAFAAVTIKSASAIEDAKAAFQPLVGGISQATTLVGMLNKTAATTPFQFEAISKAAKQLLPVMQGDLENTVETFRMLGDTAGGNAQKLESITTGYTKAMLKNKVDMESLNMIAEAGVPIYTELSDSMGITVAELTKMSAAGTITSGDLTEAFQKMTTEGGIFFNGMEIASQTASGKLSTLKDIFVLLSAEIGNKILPVWKTLLDGMINAGSAMTAFVQDGEKMRALLNVVLPIISGVAAGLVSFLVITKVIAVVKGLSTAMAVLNAVLAANPAILIATAIAVVVAAIVVLIRNWDQFIVFFDTTIAKTTVRIEQFASALSTGWVVAFNSVKIAVLELTMIIFNKLIGGINTFLDLAGKLPFIGEKFQDIQSTVNGFASDLGNLKAETVANSKAVIASQKAENAAIQAASLEKIEAIRNESSERIDNLELQEQALEEYNQDTLALTVAAEEEKTDIIKTALSDRLETLENMEAQANLDNIATFSTFLETRMEQEAVATEDRYAFLVEEQARVLELENLSQEERLAAIEAFEEARASIVKETNDAIVEDNGKTYVTLAQLHERHKDRMQAAWDEVSSIAMSSADTLAGAVDVIVDALGQWGDESEKSVALQKALGIASTIISTASAAMAAYNALAGIPYVGPALGAIAATAVGVAGAIEVANIKSTTVASAETGGTFTVPEASGATRSDNVGMNVNAGETVTVSPRGESGTRMITVNNYLDREVLWSVTQEGLDSGEIQVNNDNIREAI